MTTELQKIEQTVEQARRVIAMGDALERMFRSSEFKFVILQGLFSEELQSLVLEKTDLAKCGPVHQDHLSGRIDAIGHLQRYFQSIRERAEVAHKTLMDGETLLDELRAETN